MASAMTALWRKECHIFCAPLPVASMVLAWIAWGLYFLAAFQEYQVLAPKLAALSTPRGASDMLLLPTNRLLLWLLALWLVFFAARSIGEEYTFGTMAMYRRRFVAALLAKAGTAFLFGVLFTLPFWVCVFWLSRDTRFDYGVLVGVGAAQVLILLYCCLMACTIALWLKQALGSALFAALLLVLSSLLPNLVSSPAGLVAMLQWLSPFAHAELLCSGTFALQSLIFIVLHSAFFVSFITYFHLEDH